MNKKPDSLREFDFFNLNELRLDEEWINQPKLYYTYAAKLARRRKRHEQAKANLNVVESELSREMRRIPKIFGIDKVSESAIEKFIPLQHSYKEALEKVIEAKHEMDIMQAAVDALDHRKKALENLTHLYAMNYFSEPRLAKTMTEEERERTRAERKKKSIIRPEIKGKKNDE